MSELLFTFTANGNPQSGIKWQNAKKTWKNTCAQSVFCGHHIYKEHIWSPYIVEHLTLQRKDSNTHDRHAVCSMKGIIVLWGTSLVNVPVSHKVLACLVKILAVLAMTSNFSLE